MKRMLATFSAVALLAGVTTGIASAHANLLRSSIPNNAVFRFGHTPKMITGYFAENLDPAHSWMAVFEGVADHGLVTEKDHSVVNFRNPKEMTLSLAHTKLTADKYYLIWYTHSADDGHYASGIVYFQVK